LSALLGSYAAKADAYDVFFNSLVVCRPLRSESRGNALYEGAKLILLARSLLPCSVARADVRFPRHAPNSNRAAMWVLLFVLSASFDITWTRNCTALKGVLLQHLSTSCNAAHDCVRWRC
jgi:hypothetical protein